MGLFDDFDIDMDEVKEAGGFTFDDGTYDFVISEALTQNGTKTHPDNTNFIIKYDFDENGVYWEWFTIAVGGDPTAPRAVTGLSFLKRRLQDLGFQASELNDIEPEDLEGISGALTIATKQGRGKNAGNAYQNVTKVVVSDADGEIEKAPEPVVDTKAADAAAKRRVAARQAERAKAEEPAPAAPARRPRRTAAAPVAEDEGDEDNPFV
jgi:hypothetical protein